MPCDLWQIKHLVKTVEEMFDRYGHETLKVAYESAGTSLDSSKSFSHVNSDSIAVLIVKAPLGQGHLLKYPVSH